MDKSFGQIYKTHKECTEEAREPETFAHAHDGFLDTAGRKKKKMHPDLRSLTLSVDCNFEQILITFFFKCLNKNYHSGQPYVYS